MRAIVLCNRVFTGAGSFINECRLEGMKVKKLGGFRYSINDVQVEFKKVDFSSIAGARADMLVTDIEDSEIEASRSYVLCHSQFEEGRYIKTTKDLMEFLKKNTKDKQYYVEQYNQLWDECLKEAGEECSDDVTALATEIFEEKCGVDEVVGYYIVLHEDSALKDWKDNIAGIELSEQDKEVDKILGELYERPLV